MSRQPRRDKDTRTTTEAGLGWAHIKAAAAVMANARNYDTVGPKGTDYRLVDAKSQAAWR